MFFCLRWINCPALLLIKSIRPRKLTIHTHYAPSVDCLNLNNRSPEIGSNRAIRTSFCLSVYGLPLRRSTMREPLRTDALMYGVWGGLSNSQVWKFCADGWIFFTQIDAKFSPTSTMLMTWWVVIGNLESELRFSFWSTMTEHHQIGESMPKCLRD